MIHVKQIGEPFGAPCDRRVFGHFIESGFGRQVAGMWAEMLFNRAFRDIKPYTYYAWEWLGFEAALYNEAAPFWHTGYEEHDWRLIGEHTTKEHTVGSATHKGKTSLMLNGPGGISQSGLHLKKGQAYTFSLMAGVRGKLGEIGLNGFGTSLHDDDYRPVRIRFADVDGRLIDETVFQMGTMQRKHVRHFTASADAAATLCIEFDWPGTLMLSCASLMPDDNMSGWRRDVVEQFRKVRPPVVRFPGGCFVSFYDWESSVGDRDVREPQDSYYWGGLEENDVGVDEFMALSDLCGFAPQMCFNMMTSTPFKARQLVEYLNAPEEAGMGRLRALNGHPIPYGAKLFEMDNEPDRKWTAEQYANQCVAFTREMRMADPSIELLMACYAYPLEALPMMLDIAGGDVEYVIYRNGDPDFVCEALELIRAYNQGSGRHIRLVNTEWLPSCGSPEPFDNPRMPVDFHWHGEMTNDYDTVFSTQQITWNYALNCAHRLMDYMGYGPEFALANFNNCCNTWGQNIIEATKRESYLSCAGEVFAFFARTFAEGRAAPTASDEKLVHAQLMHGADGYARVYLVNHSSESVCVALPGENWRTIDALAAKNRLSRQDEVRRVEPVVRENVVELPPLCVACVSRGK